MAVQKLKGRWHVRWTDEIGRDHKKVMPKNSTKEQAEAFLRDIKVRIDRIKEGLEVRQRNPEKLTVADATGRWLKARKRNTRDVQTINAHITNTDLGDVPLERVTAARINAHLAALQPSTKAVHQVSELGPGTRNHVRKHLISIFKLAIARGWYLGDNPARGSAREEIKRRTLVTLTVDEAIAVVSKASFPWNAIIACGLLGLRRGEIWGADRVDVDTDAWVFHVRHSHDRETKSGRERIVPIHPAFRPLIVQVLQTSKGDALFPATKAGKRRSENSKGQREFRAALTAAGVTRRVRFHDLRHTAATIMLQSGATLVHVSRVLGHASISITSDIYGHLVVDDLRSAIERMPIKLPALAAVKESQ